MDVVCLLYGDRCSFYHRFPGKVFRLLYVEGEECTQVRLFRFPQWKRLLDRVWGSLGLETGPSIDIQFSLVADESDPATELVQSICDQRVDELTTHDFGHWMRQTLPDGQAITLAFHEFLWASEGSDDSFRMTRVQPWPEGERQALSVADLLNGNTAEASKNMKMRGKKEGESEIVKPLFTNKKASACSHDEAGPPPNKTSSSETPMYQASERLRSVLKNHVSSLQTQKCQN